MSLTMKHRSQVDVKWREPSAQDAMLQSRREGGNPLSNRILGVSGPHGGSTPPNLDQGRRHGPFPLGPLGPRSQGPPPPTGLFDLPARAPTAGSPGQGPWQS